MAGGSPQENGQVQIGRQILKSEKAEDHFSPHDTPHPAPHFFSPLPLQAVDLICHRIHSGGFQAYALRFVTVFGSARAGIHRGKLGGGLKSTAFLRQEFITTLHYDGQSVEHSRYAPPPRRARGRRDECLASDAASGFNRRTVRIAPRTDDMHQWTDGAVVSDGNRSVDHGKRPDNGVTSDFRA